jgi:hypothetical protein
MVGSKTRSVENAKTILNHATPDLLQAVQDAAVSLSDAASIARLPASEQIIALAAVKRGEAKTMAEAAKAIRPESRPVAASTNQTTNGAGIEHRTHQRLAQLCADLEALRGPIYLDQKILDSLRLIVERQAR